MLIYKILTATQWAALERDGATAGAPVDLADGFVHFSTGPQVARTAGKHFAAQARLKLLAEIAIAAVAVYWIVALTRESLAMSLAVPFFKTLLIPLGWFYLGFAGFVVVGASNAVNLTDGLDGLAIMPVTIAAASFGIIAYLVGNFNFAGYLQIVHVPDRKSVV